MGRQRKSNTKQRKRHKTNYYYDYNLLASIILLTCFGLVMLYSTSSYEAQTTFGNDMHYFSKQARISAVCLVFVLFLSQINYHRYIKLAPFIYLVSNVLLILTKYIGREIYGAKRWIYFGPVSFQPSELGKLAVIMFLAYLIPKFGKNMKGAKIPVLVMGFGAFTSILIGIFTENLSTAIITFGIASMIIFISHPKTKPFIISGAGVAAAIVLGVRLLVSTISNSNDFRLNRILVWLDPEANASRGGYQVMQGLYAIGSGGFFGKGLGNSAQKLGAVPEAQNDMIFTIVCEELGVFGAAILTLMFVFLLYRLMFIAQNAPDLSGSLMVTGIFAHISLQVFLNIAVVINLIPTTGVTLPFVSYGGTSIVFLMAEMTLALSVSRRIKFKDENIKYQRA